MDSFHARARRQKSAAGPARKEFRRTGSRADQLLVERGLAASRTAAQRLIARRRVSWRGEQGWQFVRKASEMLPTAAEIRVESDISLPP